MKLLVINILLGFIVVTGTTEVGSRVGREATSSSFDKALEFVLRKEGGYVNHENDLGGATNYGVIQSTYNAYLNKVGRPIQSVSNITKEEVEEIYKQYWDSGNCGQYEPPLDIACLDSVINFGVSGGKSFFEDLPEDPKEATIRIAQERMEYRHTRVAQNYTQKVFLSGWLNRDKALEELAK